MKTAVRSPGATSSRPRPIALIADDEPFIGATLVEMLQEEGFDAIAVSDGESAVFWAEKAKPDYVIADVVMPKLNGIEVAKRLQKSVPTAKLIVFSGQAGSAELIEKAQAEGLIFEVLAKPIRPEALLAKMRSHQ
jgi:DNA-binding response OmpR family regulator